MVLKNWFKKRQEKKEKQKRIEKLSEEEIQYLDITEKTAYLKIAKKQVTYRGKINAFKDFPINDSDKIDIDIQFKEDSNKIDIDNQFKEDSDKIDIDIDDQFKEDYKENVSNENENI